MATAPQSSRLPIRSVCEQTGLTAHVIRAWERRYGAVQPQRTPTNRRLYSPEDIERLRLLHRATEAGHSIGKVAHMPSERLRALLARNARPPVQEYSTGGSPQPAGDVEGHLQACLRAVEDMAPEDLDAALSRAALRLPRVKLLEQLIVPLVRAVGERWYRGDIRPVHEHMATFVLRRFLGELIGSAPRETDAPLLAVATPAGQRHELGALIVAALAIHEGWRILYLGSSLPAEDLAAAAEKHRPAALALSLVYPADDPALPGELRRLRRLQPELDVVVGGRAAMHYAGVLDEIGARWPRDIRQTRELLRRTP